MIHPAYHSIAREMQNETRNTRSCYSGKLLTEGDEQVFSKKMLNIQIIASSVSIVSCVVAAILLYIYILHQNDLTLELTEFQKQLRATVASPLYNPTKDLTNEHDITIIKDVLNNLVVTIDKLSKQTDMKVSASSK